MQGTAQIRFYAELNDFLPREKRAADILFSPAARQNIRQIIENLGIPHTEVDLVLVNGDSVNFAYVPSSGDRISVYPVFETLDIALLSRVRPQPLREVRFVLDSHLGRLAVYLRMLGFDALLPEENGDRNLARISAEERRVLLTRDRSLLMHAAVTHGYRVRNANPRHQLVEVIRRLDLAECAKPLARCLVCNVALEEVPKESVLRQIPSRSRDHCERFWRCAACSRIYWNGSHHQRMLRFLEQALEEARREAPPVEDEPGAGNPPESIREL